MQGPQLAMSVQVPTPTADAIFAVSATDVTALATIVLAVVGALAFLANAVLAFMTWRVATATNEAAQASKEAAEAGQAEAAASRATVDEMRRDRELEYRPYLSWRLTEVTTNGRFGPVVDTPSPRVEGANFGRGPALHCLFVAFWPDEATKVRSPLLFDLSPNEALSAIVRAEPRGWSVPGRDVTGARPAGAKFIRVAFCQDQLGNSYRFVPFRVDADVWQPKEPRPAWLDWYEARRKDLELI